MSPGSSQLSSEPDERTYLETGAPRAPLQSQAPAYDKEEEEQQVQKEPHSQLEPSLKKDEEEPTVILPKPVLGTQESATLTKSWYVRHLE